MNEIKAQYGLSDNQVSENTALLGLMGQSENSTMQSLYIVAGFLVLLVLIAGAVMIAASFNTNVLERIQFYGLLRLSLIHIFLAIQKHLLRTVHV